MRIGRCSCKRSIALRHGSRVVWWTTRTRDSVATSTRYMRCLGRRGKCPWCGDVLEFGGRARSAQMELL